MKNRRVIILTIILVLVVSVSLLVVYFRSLSNKSPTNTPSLATEENQTSTYDKTYNSLKIMAAGDILLARGVDSRLKKNNLSYSYPFEEVASILRKGDIVFGNLESPITTNQSHLAGITEKGGKYIFSSNPESVAGLTYAGFNILNIANNHILDYYEKGLMDTIDILDKHNIAHSGAGKNLDEARKLAIIEKNGIKVGVLSYTDMAEITYKGNPPLKFAAGQNKIGVSPLIKESVLSDIYRVRGDVDLLIVSLHWGIEESFVIPERQREFAHTILDHGADAILGHHPHQFQGIEIYKEKPIVYSLGNFLFDQNDPENQEGFIVELDYKYNKLVDFNAVPIRISDKTRVTKPVGDDAKNLIDRQISMSNRLNTECSIKDNLVTFSLR